MLFLGFRIGSRFCCHLFQIDSYGEILACGELHLLSEVDVDPLSLVTVMVYVPGVSPICVNFPSLSVVIVFVKPVSGFLTVTVTLA